MDVTRMIEEVREKFEVDLETSDVYMATTFEEFSQELILEKRGTRGKAPLVIDYVHLHINNREIRFPHELLINNQFIPSSNPSKKLKSINPNDESLICEVECATVEDVDKAVKAAAKAFESGEWSQMNSRDRGKLLNKLADLMERELLELERSLKCFVL